MIVKDEDDFPRLKKHIRKYRQKYPMFSKDVERLQKTIDSHITEYSKLMVQYRNTKSGSFLAKADEEIKKINNIISTIEKIELLKHLSNQ